MKRIQTGVAVLLLLSMVSNPAWSQNEIVKNDSAKLLRKVWMMRGSVAGGDKVGQGAGSVGDINHDSLMDLAWYHGRLHQWFIHLGSKEGISTTPYQVLDSLGAFPRYPLWGNFYGDGSLHVMFPDGYIADTEKGWVSASFPLYPIVGDSISHIPRAILQPTRTTWPDMTGTPQFYFAEDLDRDGDDELIAVVSVLTRSRVRDTRAEVWIFAGGPEFGLDSPTVVLKDDEENDDRFWVQVGDLDGDHYPEIITGALYKGDGRPAKLKFWWGGPELSGFSSAPDRSITLVEPLYPRIGNGLTLVDCDGDGVKDLWFPGPDGRYYLYGMGVTNKNSRTRSLRLDDAERSYGMGGFGGISYRVGYLNDSLDRYEMVGISGAEGGGSVLGVLSGSPTGPNETYDAYYSAAADGLIAGDVFSVGGSVGDATGDGWDDYLTGNPAWYGLEQGIVLLLAGGPYIPNDDPTVSVREEPIAGESGGLYLWPNPMKSELHIAWKGNLKKQPSRFVVYDLAGRLIVEGDVGGWRGEAIWRCGGVASGVYVLTAIDREGEVIASTRVIKE